MSVSEIKMEELLSKNDLFREQRNKYIEEFNEFNKKKEEEEIKKVKDDEININRNHAYTNEELMSMCNKFVEEYKKIQDNKIDKLPGVSYELIEIALNKKYKPHAKEDNYNHIETDLSSTFKMIIYKFNEYGFKIYGITTYLENFHNRRMSALCDDTTVFVFYCGTEYYDFVVKFLDDSDCFPGILKVKQITQKSNGMKYKISSCDIFNQNCITGETLINFLLLLKFPTIEDYLIAVNEQYDKVINFLCDKFSINKNKDKDKSQVSDDDSIKSISLEHYRKLFIKNENVDLRVAMSFVGDINVTVGPDYKRGSINGFDNFHNNSYRIVYKDDNDNELLIQCITDNIRVLSGLKGYKDVDGNIYGKEQLNKFFDQFKLDRYSIAMKYYSNDRLGKEYKNDIADIDYSVNITIGCDHDSLVLREYKSNLEYPVEFYTIRLLYNEKKDKLCHLNIIGEYRFSSFAIEYYKDRDNFINNMDRYLVNKEIGKYETSGNFKTVFEKIKYFAETIISKNNKLDK